MAKLFEKCVSVRGYGYLETRAAILKMGVDAIPFLEERAKAREVKPRMVARALLLSMTRSREYERYVVVFQYSASIRFWRFRGAPPRPTYLPNILLAETAVPFLVEIALKDTCWSSVIPCMWEEKWVAARREYGFEMMRSGIGLPFEVRRRQRGDPGEATMQGAEIVPPTTEWAATLLLAGGHEAGYRIVLEAAQSNPKAWLNPQPRFGVLDWDMNGLRGKWYGESGLKGAEMASRVLQAIIESTKDDAIRTEAESIRARVEQGIKDFKARMEKQKGPQ